MVVGAIQQAAEDRAVKKILAEVKAAAASEGGGSAAQGMLNDGVWRGDSAGLLVEADLRWMNPDSPYARRSDRYAAIQKQLEALGYKDTFYFEAVSKMVANLANMDNEYFGGVC
jgi:hypothetical protein